MSMSKDSIQFLVSSLTRFEPEDDVEGEKRKLSDFISSEKFREQTETIEDYLKLASLKLVESKPKKMADESGGSISKHESFISSTLAIESSSSDPPKTMEKFKLAQTIWKTRFVRPLCWILLIYMVIKFNVLAFQRYKHDAILKKYNPLVKANTNRTNSCALSNNIYQENESVMTKLNEAHRMLLIIGDPTISFSGGTIVFYLYLAWLPFFYYFLDIPLFKFKRVKVDILGFIFDPIGERERLRNESIKIADGLVDSLPVYTNLINAMKYTKESLSRRITLRHSSVQVEFKTDTFSKQKSSADVSEQLLNESSQFAELLKDTCRSGLVKPASLSAAFHQEFLKFFTVSLWKNRVLGHYATYSVISLLLMMEVYLRAKQRADSIDCQKWNPNGQLIYSPINLRALENNSELEAYHNSDRSILNLLYLGIVIEAKYFLTINILITYMEVSILQYMICHWWSMYLSLYIMSLLHNMRWICHINIQLKDCIKKYLHHLNASHDQARGKTEDESNNLIVLTTITYMNYALFKSQFKQYKVWMNILTAKVIVLCTTLIILSYFIATDVHSPYGKYSLVVMSYYFGTVNSYLICGTFILGIAQGVMKKVVRLLALGIGDQNSSSSMKYLMNLWYRQLLSDSELASVYAISFAGTKITLSQIVTFNGHLLALWLILSPPTVAPQI